MFSSLGHRTPTPIVHETPAEIPSPLCWGELNARSLLEIRKSELEGERSEDKVETWSGCILGMGRPGKPLLPGGIAAQVSDDGNQQTAWRIDYPPRSGMERSSAASAVLVKGCLDRTTERSQSPGGQMALAQGGRFPSPQA